MAKKIVSDRLWRFIEPLVVNKYKSRHKQNIGRKPIDARKVLSGIIFVLRTGIPWRSLPASPEFPSGYTCRRVLRKWHKRGIFLQLFVTLLSELNKFKKIDWRRALVDSSSVRAPRGGRKTGPSPVDRRKLGSKHHLLTDAHGVPLAITLSGANRHDITELVPLVDKIPFIHGRHGKPRHRPRFVQGDRAYDSEPHRKELKKKRDKNTSC